MQSVPSHSGDLSQDSSVSPAHPTLVSIANFPRPAASGGVVDPSARTAKRAYDALSASSVGLELGISVVLGVLFGVWLDGQLGTAPWMMLLFMVLGLVAGFRGALRAMRRADRQASAEAQP